MSNDELRFGDIVGSVDVKDKRRWVVTHADLINLFQFIGAESSGIDFTVLSLNYVRKDLPKDIRVFYRLVDVSLPEFEGLV